MDFKSLNYMLVLQEEGLLSLAAKRLGISQSSLSLYLLRLEERYETPFYDRKKHCMTEAGQLYCEGAKKILLLHKKAVEDVRAHAEHPSFSLGINLCMNETASPLITALMEHSSFHYPQVALQVAFLPEQTLRDQLQQTELDLVFSYFPRSGLDTLNRRILLKESMLLVTPPDFPYSGPENVFQSLAYIAMFKGSILRSACDAFFYMHHLSPFAQLESSSYAFTKAMMASGRYAAIIPAGAAAYFSSFALHPIRPSLQVASGFYLPKDPPNSAYFFYLMETLKQQLYETCLQNPHIHIQQEEPYEP